MHRFFCFTVVIALFGTGVRSLAAEKANEPKSSDEIKDGDIVVHLKGTLRVSATMKKDASPRSRPQDDEAWELSSASVLAGGHEVMLDWSESDEVRDELFWHRFFRHGDGRDVQAEVVGRMVFRPARKVGGWRQQFAGIADETPVPVVIVETLTVRLVGPDGKPRGPQPTRPETQPGSASGGGA